MSVRRQPGLIEFVDIGCVVWSAKRGYKGVDEFTDDQVEPIGGVVIAVTEKLDTDSGEIDRSFLVVDHTRTRPFLRWNTLTELEVNKAAIEWPDSQVHVRLWRRLAEDIVCSAPHKHRKGVATTGEVRAARAILNLQELVFGQHGDLHSMLDTPSQGAPSAPRPTAPPAPAAMFVD